MEIFHGYQFQEFVEQALKRRINNDLLDRAVNKGILVPSGVFYLRSLNNE